VNGSFSGVGFDVMSGDPSSAVPFLSLITVTNDVGKFSYTQITAMALAQNVPGVTFASAFTNKQQPYTNYTGSGHLDPQDVIEDQIFELGNSLSAITGKNPSPADETDANKLLDCYKNGGPGK
jgi:hypothetical protein